MVHLICFNKPKWRAITPRGDCLSLGRVGLRSQLISRKVYFFFQIGWWYKKCVDFLFVCFALSPCYWSYLWSTHLLSPNFGFSLNPSVGGRYQELVLLNARDPFSTCIWHQPLSKNLRANARLFTVVHHEILKGILH